MTPKQLKFAEQYVIDFNGRQAAIRAGYSTSSAASIACELLKKPDVESKVRELNSQFSEDYFVSKSRVVEKIASIAFDDDRPDQIRALDLLLKHLEKEVPDDDDSFEVRHVFEFPHNGRDEPAN